MKIRLARYTYPWYFFVGSVYKIQVQDENKTWKELDIVEIPKEEFFK